MTKCVSIRSTVVIVRLKNSKYCLIGHTLIQNSPWNESSRNSNQITFVQLIMKSTVRSYSLFNIILSNLTIPLSIQLNYDFLRFMSSIDLSGKMDNFSIFESVLLDFWRDFKSHLLCSVLLFFFFAILSPRNDWFLIENCKISIHHSSRFEDILKLDFLLRRLRTQMIQFR